MPRSEVNNIVLAEVRATLIAKMTNAGLSPADPSEIVLDGSGQIRRYRVDGDKTGRRNGWYVAYLDHMPSGAFGCWRRRVSQSWCVKDRSRFEITDRAAMLRATAAAKEHRALERESQHRQAAEKALKLVDQCFAADPFHPYLISKNIKPHTALQRSNMLVLRVMGFDRGVHSLQFIRPDGAKTFLRGGRKKGNFIHVAGRVPGASRILIAEGFATAATLAESDPDAFVLAALDAGNLRHVAVGARERWPNSHIVVCGDADEVGLAAAHEAAEAASAMVSVPDFDEAAQGSDFNDLAALQAEATA